MRMDAYKESSNGMRMAAAGSVGSRLAVGLELDARVPSQWLCGGLTGKGDAIHDFQAKTSLQCRPTTRALRMVCRA
jgi:hypothetical protein